MGYFLPLFQPHPIFLFIETTKTNSDLDALKVYFESNQASDILKCLEENDQKWVQYLDELLKVRRLTIFGTESQIPDEKTKIDECAKAGNQLAIDMSKILDYKAKFPRTWPIREVEEEKKRYLEWKEIKAMEEQAFKYLLFEALKAIYYPKFFFEKEIFKLEEEYKGFKYDFMGFLGSDALYLTYLIYKKEGTVKAFDNLQDFIINRYIPKTTVGVDIFGLLLFFMWNGNDVNNCDRFFTRRMKRDIYQESVDHLYMTNNIASSNFKDAFERMFYTDRYSVCKIRKSFENVYNEPGLIEQAFLNHLIGNYSAAVNLLFPLIEGIIWDISVAEHLKNGGIYTPDSDLTTRDVRKRTLLKKDGSQIAKPHGYPTLKDLLESTRMDEIFKKDFLELLVQELYPSERNPILHGVKLEYNTPWQSSRMLLILEYLHHLIKEQKYLYPEQLDEQGYWTPEKSKEEPKMHVDIC